MKTILERRTTGEVPELSGPNFTQEVVKRNNKRLIMQYYLTGINPQKQRNIRNGSTGLLLLR